MKLEFDDLSRQGLIIEPRELTDRPPSPFAGTTSPEAFFDQNRDAPELVGAIPNLREFASGGDINVGAFEIKAQGTSIVCLPDNLACLLPAAQIAIDDFYHHAGKTVADQCRVSLQFFRFDYEVGSHLVFDRIHRHAVEGKMVIYVMTAIDPAEKADPIGLGTEFYSPEVIGKRVNRPKVATSQEDFRQQFADPGVVIAPGGGMLIRFSETTLHSAPDITHTSAVTRGFFGPSGRKALRRSLINIIASYKQPDGAVYGRTREPNDHRENPVQHVTEHEADYRAKAEQIMAEISGLVGS